MLETDWTGTDQAVTDESEPQADKPKKSKQRRMDVTPYIEAQQVLLADLTNSGEVLTYSTVAVGVDASVAERNAEAQISLRYERVIGYDNDIDDQDVISGIARGSAQLTRNISIEAGGLASRSKIDNRGTNSTAFLGREDNVTQVWSVYTGPSLTAQVGDLAVGASYRAGYTKVEDKAVANLPTGQVRSAIFDESVSHAANASVGMAPGQLPFGWAVSAGWNREDASLLDQRYDDRYVRGDVTVPVTPTLAVVGGIGYEDVRVSERDALRDANGAILTAANGRPLTDNASPRLTAFHSDGIIWDAGVLWRPSPRTSLEARYGRRYGSDTYLGSLSYTPNERMGVNVSVYDTVSGFGGSLNRSLAALPTQFTTIRNPLSGDIGSCTFATSGSGCFNNSLGNLRGATFRARGISASMATKAGGWDSGIAVGYNRQRFLTSGLGALPELNGLIDENYHIVGYLGRELDRQSRFETNVYGTLTDPGFALAPDIYNIGANAAYYRQIWRGLSAGAAVGIDSVKPEDFEGDVTASALVGLRYSF
ncbi:MAG: hypothetical protein ACRCY3_07635 [Sphingorhabdus sp.]